MNSYYQLCKYATIITMQAFYVLILLIILYLIKRIEF